MNVDTGLPKDFQDFAQARTKAFWRQLLSFVTGRPNHLLSWDEVHDAVGVTESHHRGTQSVPVAQIVGSVGRYQDFDRAFLPAKDTLEWRWRSIARAHYQAVSLPPVELYKAGDAYFCVDGHHRVSVARQRGLKFIEAHVIEVATRVPVSDHLDADELEIVGEYARFLDLTRLDKLRPDQRIEFTIGGGYERLLEHIALHQYSMGNAGAAGQKQAVLDVEVICDWYDRVYLPLVRLIREQDILADFPRRTEADLYLWIVDHQDYLRGLCGPGVILERVAEHFAERHTGNLLKRAISTLRERVPMRERMLDTECELLTKGVPDAEANES
jgi:hypothetical protein